jgi:hypothetical protein
MLLTVQILLNHLILYNHLQNDVHVRMQMCRKFVQLYIFPFYFHLWLCMFSPFSSVIGGGVGSFHYGSRR